jgi:hypothetical protein
MDTSVMSSAINTFLSLSLLVDHICHGLDICQANLVLTATVCVHWQPKAVLLQAGTNHVDATVYQLSLGTNKGKVVEIKTIIGEFCSKVGVFLVVISTQSCLQESFTTRSYCPIASWSYGSLPFAPSSLANLNFEHDASLLGTSMRGFWQNECMALSSHALILGDPLAPIHRAESGEEHSPPLLIEWTRC